MESNSNNKIDKNRLSEVKQKNVSIGEKLNGYNPMIEGVRWSERYASSLERVWKYIPNWLGQMMITIAIFLLASGIQGKNCMKLCSKKMNVKKIILQKLE